MINFANVLILIVVEDGLVQKGRTDVVAPATVLILIVVEDGLVPETGTRVINLATSGLNPYCSGRWSRT